MVFISTCPIFTALWSHRLAATDSQVSDWKDWEDEANGKTTVAQMQQMQAEVPGVGSV